MDSNGITSRRGFIGSLAVGAGALAGISNNAMASAFDASPALVADADEWFKKVKGKHKIVFDATEGHGGMQFIWTWVYYQTNNATATTDTDMTGVVVLRHNAIPFALPDGMWSKYKFGDVFGIKDSKGQSSTRNPFYEPKEGDYPLPGIDGIKQLQARGALFCVCDMALTVYSMMVGNSMSLKPEDVKKEWVSNVLPGIQVVPSGVWALGRAQEHGCGYIYAGG